MSESNAANLTAEDSFASLDRFKRNRLSRSQFGMMVDFMTLNPEIVQGRAVTNCSRESWHQKWEELAALLNADWTGAKRDAEKWRKSWHDQKCLIKARAVKRNTCKAITGTDDAYKLSDLEERVLKLIHFNGSDAEKKLPNYIKKRLNIESDSQKIFSPSNCVVLDVGSASVPASIKPANQSSSTLETANVLIGLRPGNIIPIGLESSSNIPIIETNIISASSASTVELNRLENISNVQPGLKTAVDSSEVQTQKIEESREKEKISSLIVKLQPYEATNRKVSEIIRKYQRISENKKLGKKQKDALQMRQEKSTLAFSHEVLKSKLRIRRMCKLRQSDTTLASENSEISSASEDNQESNMPDETEENVMHYSIQDSSSNPPVKKRKVSHEPFRRRNEFGVAKLLQRQNRLLEGISRTLTRIERSVKDRSSVEVQRKNDMLINISENIERLAESLGTVSKSLKTIADN